MLRDDGDLLVRRIGRLLPMSAPPLPDAAVLIRAGRVAWFGSDRDLPGGDQVAEIDAAGALVTPGFVDSHTHAVWAGTRREEAQARLAGRPYAAGGIRTTVEATRAATAEDLVGGTVARLRTMLAGGTTTVEVKTGYGLSPEHELRLLDVIGVAAAEVPLRVEATYLGAHVVPEGTDAKSYVEEVVATLPAARDRGARWCDVFCDEGAFSPAQAERVLRAARQAGLGLRLHAEELAPSGGAALAARLHVASADHLEHVTPESARSLAKAGVVAGLLPVVPLVLRSGRHDHAAILREAGVRLAVATDCNPGTAWCESMVEAVRLACLLLRLSPLEALEAATAGGAAALRRTDVGHLGLGARGDLAVFGEAHEVDLVTHIGSSAVTGAVVGGHQVGERV